MRTKLALVILVLFVASAAEEIRAQKLPDRYKEWLEKDAVYLISKEEKALFRNLSTDEDRDKFITQFWEIRNPAPGSPSNRFREEHYQRMAYVQQNFGKESATDGWRTDRGRIYILLGPPQQRMFHTSHQKLRPFEVWFYSSPSPALPPFFYVVFYQKDNIGDYRFYSPYVDGPTRLVNSHQAEQGRPQALKVIEEVAGREIARISLSLLPDEPVDLDGATSSLQSDILISALRDLANHPLHRSEIARRKEILENVSYRLIHEEADALDVLAVPFRGPQGEINLHYAMRLRKPGSLAVRQDGDRYDYRIQALVRVMDMAGKLLFTQEKDVTKLLDKPGVDALQRMLFGYQGWVPLAPGKYRVEFTLTSWNNSTAFRTTKDVVIADVPKNGYYVTPLLAFQSVEPATAGTQDYPFTLGGLRFRPFVGQDWSIGPSGDLNVLYQVWAAPQPPRAYGESKLDVEYAYGRPAARGDSTAVRDSVAKSQFDPAGSLVNGKKLRMEQSVAGNYLLAVTVEDPETHQKGFGRFSFRVGSLEAPAAALDLIDDGILEYVRSGAPDYQRALCFVASGNNSEAKVWFLHALQRNPENKEARARLADLYFAESDHAGILQLYAGRALVPPVDERTVLHVAESYEKLGQRKAAIQALRGAVDSRPPNGNLYKALADLYQRDGDTALAAQWTKKAEALK